MKILFHHRIASKDGQYVHMSELIRAFRSLGHEVVVVGPEIMEEEYGGVAGAVDWLKRHVPSFIYELLEFGYNIPALFRILREIRRHSPDIIYERYNLNFISGILAARVARLPLLLEVNAPLFMERSRYGGLSCRSLAKWTERYSWKNATHLFPVTGVLSEIIADSGVPQERMTVIHNGICRSDWDQAPSRNEAKRELGLEDSLVLGFSGFVREWHGMDRVLDYMANHGTRRDMHLLLVGDGPAREDLEQQAKRLGLSERFTITGYVDHEEVRRYVCAFDIALQPDVVEYASPLKIFEYMAAGCAILAPDRRNIREIVRHEAEAILFDADAPEAFAEGLARLCNDDTLRERLGRGARDRLIDAGFDWVQNARRVAAVAGRLLGADRE